MADGALALCMYFRSAALAKRVCLNWDGVWFQAAQTRIGFGVGVVEACGWVSRDLRLRPLANIVNKHC